MSKFKEVLPYLTTLKYAQYAAQLGVEDSPAQHYLCVRGSMQEVEVVIFLEEFKVVLRCLEGRQGLRVDPGILVSWSDPRTEDASLESNFPCHLCFGQVFLDDPVVERNQLQEWIPGKLVLVLQPPSSTFHLRFCL